MPPANSEVIAGIFFQLRLVYPRDCLPPPSESTILILGQQTLSQGDKMKKTNAVAFQHLPNRSKKPITSSNSTSRFLDIGMVNRYYLQP